jgi:hypothetical protein
MKWRTLLAVLFGLLLPLPLLWLECVSAYAFIYGTDLSRPWGWGHVPMLSIGARYGLPTYGVQCFSDADCDSPLRCFIQGSERFHRCMDSACVTDKDCPEDFTCRNLAVGNGRDLLRVCLLVGGRTEGQPCERFAFTREEGCARGFLCNGTCGRPCRLNAPSSCPEGFLCERGEDGPLCKPVRQDPPCPAGELCFPVSPAL